MQPAHSARADPAHSNGWRFDIPRTCEAKLRKALTLTLIIGLRGRRIRRVVPPDAKP
jgi:hypothetical protein